MRERVNVIVGKQPIIFIAPYGADDLHTDKIAQVAAEFCDGFAVVNRGFERSTKVNVSQDKANCNRIDHLVQDVVKEEFLNPVEKNIARSLKILGALPPQHLPNLSGYYMPPPVTDDRVMIFNIQGVDDDVHQLAERPDIIGSILGIGLGLKNDSMTTDIWRVHMFVDLWRKIVAQGEIYIGSGGGKFAGRHKNNFNQYFVKNKPNSWVTSMQIKIPHCQRQDASDAEDLGCELGLIATSLMIGREDPNEYQLAPDLFFI